MYYGKKDILKRLKEHNAYVNTLVNGTIIGTFLYGSQNYHLENPESDIDSISIYIPTQEEIYFNKNWISKEYEMANREHAVIKDIRVLMRDWLNGSMTNLEVLFTHFYVMKADEITLNIFKSIKKIIREYLISNKEKMARVIHGQMLSAAKGKFLTPKKIKNIVRLYYALKACELVNEQSIDYVFELNKTSRQKILKVYNSLLQKDADQVVYRVIADKYIKESEQIKDKLLEMKINETQISNLKKILQDNVQLLINHINK